MFDSGSIHQDGNIYSGVSPQTGWSPQFEGRAAAVAWLKERGIIVPGEVYESEATPSEPPKKSFWSRLKFWK